MRKKLKPISKADRMNIEAAINIIEAAAERGQADMVHQAEFGDYTLKEVEDSERELEEAWKLVKATCGVTAQAVAL